MSTKKKPTIAIISNTSWNIYNFRIGLLQDLKRQGYNVIAIAPKDEFSKYLKKIEGCTYLSVRHLARKKINPVIDLFFCLELRNILKKYKIDLILTFTIKPNIFGTLATWGLRTKSICTITGLGSSFIRPGSLRSLTIFLYRIAFKSADRVVFQNNDDQELFLKKAIVPPAKAKLIHGSGINSSFFSFRPMIERENTGEVHFLFVGRLLKDKGILEFLKAIEIVEKDAPYLQFKIVGSIDTDNPTAIDYDFFLNWLSTRKNVTHVQKVLDIRPFLEKTDVVVLPSFREGLPRVILEAMATGRAIITTDAPGCKDTIKDGLNGLVVRKGNEEDLASAIKRIASFPYKKRAKMGQVGRELVLTQFEENLILREYSFLVKNLIFMLEPVASF